MTNNSLKSKVISGVFWKALERGGVQGLQFIIQLVLARLLLPEDYGIVVLTAIFIVIAKIFVQSGFVAALIQRSKIDEIDYSSVFYLNLCIAVIMYGILCNSASYIANFYSEPLLEDILKIQGLSLFIGAFNAVQTAVVQRAMNFKKLFYANFAAIVAQGILGIFMAYFGFGVWSLVYSTLLHELTLTIVLWIIVKWRPKLLFSFQRVKKLFNFGANLLISNLIDGIYTNMYSLVIGKLYNKDILGYYNRGESIPKLIVSNLDGTIHGVLFPALSSLQEEKYRLKKLVRRSIQISCFLTFPLMIGLAVIAEPLTIILLGDKWLPSVPFMQISCITFSLWPIHTANLQAINAIGRSDIFLRLEIIKKGLGVTTLIICIPFGIYAILVGNLIYSIFCTIINSWPNKKLLNYSFIEQWKDITPSLILSIFMGAIIYTVTFLNIGVWITVGLQMFCGIVIYIFGAWLFKFSSFIYIMNNIKGLYNKKKSSVPL